ncbi:MAG: isoprenylcysteine carboxylmethyltransferase family protein [Anaerolineales bacterium]
MSNLFVLILRWCTFGIWLFWLFHYWGGISGMKQHYQESVTEANSRSDQILLLALGLFTMAPVLMILLAALGVMTFQPWARTWPAVLAGTLLTLFGAVGGYYCRNFLGSCWTPAVRAESGHHIIDTGPYGIVRHPIFTMMLVMFFGITVVFAAWWTWVVYIILVVGYVIKAEAEEKILSQYSAKEYAAYQKRVRFRLIPGLW